MPGDVYKRQVIVCGGLTPARVRLSKRKGGLNLIAADQRAFYGFDPHQVIFNLSRRHVENLLCTPVHHRLILIENKEREGERYT